MRGNGVFRTIIMIHIIVYIILYNVYMLVDGVIMNNIIIIMNNNEYVRLLYTYIYYIGDAFVVYLFHLYVFCVFVQYAQKNNYFLYNIFVDNFLLFMVSFNRTNQTAHLIFLVGDHANDGKNAYRYKSVIMVIDATINDYWVYMDAH